jgi:hypothetical protein
LNLHSVCAPRGPVWNFGPNNFLFAFNGIAGGISPKAAGISAADEEEKRMGIYSFFGAFTSR